MPTEAILAPSVAWECANCAHTNEGTDPGPCSGCGAIDPIRYMIWNRRQGGLLAPSAISARVDRSLQCLLSSANTNEQNTSATPRRANVVASLVGSMVDVVGINATNRGRQCPRHDCCGSQVEPRMKLKVIKEQMRYRGDVEEDVLAVYVMIAGGVTGCKVGFLPQHLATRRADDYAGLILRVREVYTKQCRSVVRRNKMHRNDGCAVAVVLGDQRCLEL